MSANLAAKSRSFLEAFFLAIGKSSWVLFCFVLVAVTFSALTDQFRIATQFLDTTQGQLWSGALIYVLVVSLAVLPLWLRHGRAVVLQTLGANRRPTDSIWWLPFLTWAFYMISTVIVAYVATQLLPWIDQAQEQEVGFSNLSQPYEYVLAFIALVILPPIAEELLFRGYLFGRLRKRLGFVATTIVVSLVFGLVHGQWNVGIDVAVLSVFLCWLREYTGSVWASMVLHATKNGLAYFLLFIAPLLGLNLL